MKLNWSKICDLYFLVQQYVRAKHCIVLEDDIITLTREIFGSVPIKNLKLSRSLCALNLSDRTLPIPQSPVCAHIMKLLENSLALHNLKEDIDWFDTHHDVHDAPDDKCSTYSGDTYSEHASKIVIDVLNLFVPYWDDDDDGAEHPHVSERRKSASDISPIQSKFSQQTIMI